MPNKQIIIPSSSSNDITDEDSPDLNDTSQKNNQEEESSENVNPRNASNQSISKSAEQQKVTSSDDKKGAESSSVNFSDFKNVIGKQGATLEEDDDENELSQQELDARKKLATEKAGKETKEESTEEEIPAKTTQLDGKGQQRDFSGIPENIVPVFKKMSNESFNALKPIY